MFKTDYISATWVVVVGSFKFVSTMIVREQPLMMDDLYSGKIWSLFLVIPVSLNGVMGVYVIFMSVC